MGFPITVPLSGADIFSITSDKRHPLGTLGRTKDGRTFRYARNGGTALKPCLLVQGEVTHSALLDLRPGTTEIKANSSKIKILTGAGTSGGFTTANAYADGFLYCITSSTGLGQQGIARIHSHTTQSQTATGVVTMYLADGDVFFSPSANFGTTKAEIRVKRNPYDKVVVKPAGEATQAVLGVPIRPITANYYFWLQTGGPCPVRVTGTVDAAYGVGWSSGATAGLADAVTCTKATSAANSLVFTKIRNLIGGVGTAMEANTVAGNCVLVNLKLDSGA